MKKLIILPILIFSIGLTAQKLEEGIYFTSRSMNECYKKLKLLNTDDYYCILEKPIIELERFYSVSDIYVDSASGMRSIDLKLDSIGKETLKTTTRIFKGRTLGLIVDGKLVSKLFVQSTVSEGIFKFQQTGHSNEIFWIRRKLMDAIKRNKRLTD